jgi:hypothetical protein
MCGGGSSTCSSCRALNTAKLISNAGLFNAAIVPNTEPNTTSFCLQQSYARNNAVLGHKAKSNGISFVSTTIYCSFGAQPILSPYRVTRLFNLTTTWCLRHVYAIKGELGTPLWRSVEVRGGGAVRQYSKVYIN